MLQHLAKDWTPSLAADIDGFADADGAGAALDVDAPGAVTRLHRCPLRAHVLVCQLGGEKEWVLFSPEDAAELLPGDGTCEPDQSRFDPLGYLPASVRPLRALLRPGDALLIPGGWWCWSRARLASLSQRRSFLELGIAGQVHSRLQAREEARRRATEPNMGAMLDLRMRLINAGVPLGSDDTDGILWLTAKRDELPAARAGCFAALHFTVYGLDGAVLESSRTARRACVVEVESAAGAPAPGRSGGLPTALKEVRRRGLLNSPEAAAGSRFGGNHSS